LDLLHPFSGAFFSIREDQSLKQIRTRALGSGVEIVLTLLLLRGLASESKGGIVYLLDEPELHLHPKAQEKLAQLLLVEAATKQIVVATHSPYLIRPFMHPTVNKIVLRRNSKGDVGIERANEAGWKMFPWSPSWGEVNFIAYDMATVEYHNELYGWLQEH
jgi:predicted ATPase